jgi:hypothetical protein
MKKWLGLYLLFFCLFLLLLPCHGSAQNTSGISIGYGFGLLSSHKVIGHIEEGHYNFVHISYQYQRSLNEVLSLLIEPFSSYTFTPQEGIDFGITLSLKYNFYKKKQNGFFLTIGGGSTYTSINFKEQGTHLLFILHSGLGYKWKNFFVENRFKHYSNGSTATPNRSINANIIMVGIYF